MIPKILSWNVRGCCGKEKRMLIKSSIKRWKPNVVCLQETKLRKIDDFIVRSLWGGGWCNWIALDSVGASGGILIMWDSRELEVLDLEIGSFSISCLFQQIGDHFSWSFTGVYGPVEKQLKSDFLNEIGAVIFRWNLPWCMGGDFNMIRSLEDKWGCTKRTKSMELFSDFIDDVQGIDLPLGGSKFTWSNSVSKSRIDRFLLSADWEDHFPSVMQKALPRLLSDHFPILLDGGGMKGGPKPFRFENMWLRVEGFNEMIASWWSKYEIEGTASYRLHQKLKNLKSDLKKWNLEVFGRLDQQKAQLEREIQRLDSLDDEGTLSNLDRLQRQEKIENLNNLFKMEEISWRQKSRVKWLKEGDRNTKFFHKIASANRRHNWITTLQVNGGLTDDQRVIKQSIVEYYKNLFAEEERWRPKVDDLHFSQLNSTSAEALEFPFSETEVFGALKELSGDKAPGPDGWTLAFFQSCWSILKEDIRAVFVDFHESCRFVRSLNSTFIALVPKKNGAVELKDYRPISLVGAVYKLISKVLSNRLKQVMDSLITETQHAFVGGRQIMGAVLIANEVLNTKIKSRETG